MDSKLEFLTDICQNILIRASSHMPHYEVNGLNLQIKDVAKEKLLFVNLLGPASY